MSRLKPLVCSLVFIPTICSGQQSLTDRYREAAGKILGAAMTDVEGWEKLEHLTTDIGHRLSGSDARAGDRLGP